MRQDRAVAVFWMAAVTIALYFVPILNGVLGGLLGGFLAGGIRRALGSAAVAALVAAVGLWAIATIARGGEGAAPGGALALWIVLPVLGLFAGALLGGGAAGQAAEPGRRPGRRGRELGAP